MVFVFIYSVYKDDLKFWTIPCISDTKVCIWIWIIL